MWIDAMMLSPGKTPLPFAPKSEVEFALDSPRHCRIEGEPSLVCTLSGINYGTRGTEAEVVLREFDDYRETKLGERRWKGKLPPGGEVVRQNLPVERKEYGVYSLRGEFRTASGEKGTIWPYCYAVTGKYQPGTVDPAKDFLLGSEESFGFECPDIDGGRAWYHLKGVDFAEYGRIAANRGVRLLRLGNGIWRAFEWKSVEPERGKFDFRQADYLVDHARKQNCFILGVLGNNLLKRHLPEWTLKRGKLSDSFKIHGHPAVLPDFEDWRRYVSATVRHFKGRIFYWEILNEANLTTAPEDYVKLLKIAFEECRKIDPSIKVVAPNVTGDHGGQMGEFLERFGKAGGYRYTDIVSFHPYSSREEGSPNPSRTAIDSIRRTIASFRKGLPLWNTELYYLYDNPPHPVDAGKGARVSLHPADAGRSGGGSAAGDIAAGQHVLPPGPPSRIRLSGEPGGAAPDSVGALCRGQRLCPLPGRGGAGDAAGDAAWRYALRLPAAGREADRRAVELYDRAGV
ncbi:MAG: endo-1,4-beta-xylanase [Lentisphaeria bacterium]|nr:MAG: endo-1,4-beta-xylanase [Lentisphaeria bacterium]